MRKSKFELLRIISMLLIVTHHYSVHSDWGFLHDNSMDLLYVDILSIGGKIGVNVFIIITGYFSLYNKSVISNVFSVFSKVIFYCFFIFVVYCVFNLGNVDYKYAAKILNPFGYWFINAYILLLFLVPVINKTLLSVDINLISKYISLFLFLSFMPILNHSFGNLSFFVCLYSIGAYIRINISDFKEIRMLKVIIMMAFSILSIVLTILFLRDFYPDKKLYFNGMKTPFVVLASIYIFIFFVKLNDFKNRKINSIAVSTFGVYLIHDNPLFRDKVWSYINTDFWISFFNNVYIHSLIVIPTIYTFCVVLDYVLSSFWNMINKRTRLVSRIEKTSRYLIWKLHYKLIGRAEKLHEGR